MPLYDYTCLNCDTSFEEFKSIEERLITQCPICNHPAKQVILQHKRDFTHRLIGWWRDIDLDPIYIKSRKHLKEECKKRGLYAKALD